MISSNCCIVLNKQLVSQLMTLKDTESHPICELKRTHELLKDFSMAP